MSRDPWVLVRDGSELRAGMCLELRPCSWCGKRERFLLTREVPADGPFTYVDGTEDTVARAFRCIGKCEAFDRADQVAFERAIPERRLYRLRPDATEAGETTRTTKRRREVTR